MCSCFFDFLDLGICLICGLFSICVCVVFDVVVFFDVGMCLYVWYVLQIVFFGLCF